MLRSTSIALAASLLACVAGCGVEQHDITSGQYNGLAIGMNKLEAFAVAARLGSQAASAIPCVSFLVSQRNSGDLPDLSRLEGIRVATVQGIGYTEAYFINGRVTDVSSSPRSPLASLFTAGDELGAARAKLIAALNERPDLVAYAIIRHDNKDTVDLTRVSAATDPSEYARECWSFEVSSVKPGGAFYDLTFRDNQLVRIVYRRPRFRE